MIYKLYMTMVPTPPFGGTMGVRSKKAWECVGMAEKEITDILIKAATHYGMWSPS